MTIVKYVNQLGTPLNWPRDRTFQSCKLQMQNQIQQLHNSLTSYPAVKDFVMGKRVIFYFPLDN